jgi:hypothetical protein
LTTFTGRLFSSSIDPGALLRRTLYWNPPIFAKPAGLIWFCAAIARPTSCADKPFDCSACGSRSICTWRWRPPDGYGIAAPGTVTRPGRIWLTAVSNSLPSDSPTPDSASCRIGTVEAL